MVKILFEQQNERIANLEPSFPIPHYPEEALTLSQRVAYFLRFLTIDKKLIKI